jgi:hypothetical protein
MRIKEINGTKLLFHCAWKKHEKCPDKRTKKEQLEKAAAAFEVKGITSGVCDFCAEIINQELDREELLAQKELLTRNH